MIYTLKNGNKIIVEGDVTIISRTGMVTSTHDGFMDLYYSCVSPDISCREAYERAENIHEEAFGSTKYSDYNSFKRIKSYYFKKNQ